MRNYVMNIKMIMSVMIKKAMYIVGKFIEPKTPMITITMHESLINSLKSLKEKDDDTSKLMLTRLEKQISTIKECANRAETILRKQGAIYKWNKLNIVLEYLTNNNYHQYEICNNNLYNVNNTIVLSLYPMSAEYQFDEYYYNNLSKIHGIKFDFGTDKGEREALEFIFWHEFGHYYDYNISYANCNTINKIMKNNESKKRLDSEEHYKELCEKAIADIATKYNDESKEYIRYEAKREINNTKSYEYRMLPVEYYADRFAKRMIGR